MTLPFVSVVIPCLNEAVHLEQLLDSLRHQDLSGFEVIIVDGGSTDGSLGLAQNYARQHPDFRLRLLQNAKRSTPSSLNLGIAAATGPIIVRLDGHALPPPSYLRNCVAVLEKSGAAVVGGSWDIQPGNNSLTAQAIAIAVSSPLGAGDAVYRLSAATTPRDVDTVPFGCLRSETWAKVGRYNEDLLSNEDYEFNWRVRQQNGRVHYNPVIRCQYFAQSSLAGLFHQYQRYGWWKGRMLRRNPGSLRLRQAVPMIWLLVLVGLHLAAVAWAQTWIAIIVFWLAYGLILAGYSAWLGYKHKLLLPGLALLVASFAVIHIAWSVSAWAGLGSPKDRFQSR